MEAIPDKKAPGAPLTDGEIGRDYCDGLFHMEAELAEATPEARTKGRMEKEIIIAMGPTFLADPIFVLR